jgi:hypothetical protein
MTSRQEEQAERRKLVGSNTTTTFRDMANLDLSLGGRFAVPGSKPDVSGSEEVTRYPRLPPGNPWSHDPVGVEPPTGQEIDWVEPCGTAQEIEASIASSELPFPFSDDASAPPLELTRSDSTSGGELSVRVALSSTPNPDGDARAARGVAPSPRSPLPGDVETSSSHPPSGSISREDLAELLGRLIVPAGKDREG